jgi:hypothetical protein
MNWRNYSAFMRALLTPSSKIKLIKWLEEGYKILNQKNKNYKNYTNQEKFIRLMKTLYNYLRQKGIQSK